MSEHDTKAAISLLRRLITASIDEVFRHPRTVTREERQARVNELNRELDRLLGKTDV